MEIIGTISQEVCRGLKGIFCDLDDTLTTGGKLPEVSFGALWKAQRQGLRVVIVTGRPAGWADHIARMWPVDAVIGENGAFYFWMAGSKMQRHFIQDSQTRKESKKRLAEIQKEVLEKFPKAAVSADQNYRESDLAIDFCEDIPALPSEAVEQIIDIFRARGAQVKLSSIHVNGWFGDFDKLTTCRLLLQNLWQEEMSDLDQYLYCGDSPNDEPMFTAFTHSVGVANVQKWLPRMKSHPAYCTSLEGGQGFAEMVETILPKRQ